MKDVIVRSVNFVSLVGKLDESFLREYFSIGTFCSKQNKAFLIIKKTTVKLPIIDKMLETPGLSSTSLLIHALNLCVVMKNGTRTKRLWGCHVM